MSVSWCLISYKRSCCSLPIALNGAWAVTAGLVGLCPPGAEQLPRRAGRLYMYVIYLKGALASFSCMGNHCSCRTPGASPGASPPCLPPGLVQHNRPSLPWSSLTCHLSITAIVAQAKHFPLALPGKVDPAQAGHALALLSLFLHFACLLALFLAKFPQLRAAQGGSRRCRPAPLARCRCCRRRRAPSCSHSGRACGGMHDGWSVR